MNVLYIDDELPAIEKFDYLIKKMKEIDKAATFSEIGPTLDYARKTPVDIAFLDIEMPGTNGLELAHELRQINYDTKIIFLTAYDEYALDAFSAEAVGYILKPYSLEQLAGAIDKARKVSYAPPQKLYIRTMPYFDVFINRDLLRFNSEKAKELLAVLVDANGQSVTTGQIIACLWPDRPYDENTQSLCRVTFKRLREILNAASIGYILGAGTTQRFVKPDLYDSDYQDFFKEDGKVRRTYDGRYMAQYSWAETTNAGLQYYIASEKK